MKKYFLSILTIALFAVGFAASDEDSTDSATIDEAITSNDSDNENAGITGTYEVTDKIGQTMVITLKEDKTATVTLDGKTYYCSWNRYANIGDGEVEVSFSDDPPALVFEGGVAETMYGPEILGGWLYYDYTARKAKNPNRRLQIKKVK